ncbi:hypothetical protein VULLAG_LOCUS20873 [Vulpes lagopus]
MSRFRSQVSYDLSHLLSCPNPSLSPSAMAFSTSREALWPPGVSPLQVFDVHCSNVPTDLGHCPLPPEGFLVLVPSTFHIWPSFSPALSLMTPTQLLQDDSHSPNTHHHFLCGSVGAISCARNTPFPTNSLLLISNAVPFTVLLVPFQETLFQLLWHFLTYYSGLLYEMCCYLGTILLNIFFPDKMLKCVELIK